MIISHMAKQVFCRAAVTLFIFLCAAAASAREEGTDEPLSLEPVVVTAEKRKADVQDIPSSISAFSDVNIQDAKITTIQCLSHVVPNLYIANSSGQAPQANRL